MLIAQHGFMQKGIPKNDTGTTTRGTAWKCMAEYDEHDGGFYKWDTYWNPLVRDSDAKAEAKRCGGSAKAVPLYTESLI